MAMPCAIGAPDGRRADKRPQREATMTDDNNPDNPEAEPTNAGMTRRGLLDVAGKLGVAGSLMVMMPQTLRAQEGPIKVGVMGPFTGPSSRTGDAFKKGTKLALEHARADGDIPVTINGTKRDVELVWVDSQSSPEKAVKAVTDAVNRRGVDIMVSGWHSSVAMAVTDAEAPLDIVHIGHNGESQYICEKVNENPEKYSGWFKGWASPPIFAGLYGEPLNYFIEQGLWNPRNRKAAVLVEDTDYGRGWGEALQNSLKEAGFDPLPYDVVPKDETEFTALLTKYRAQQVSVVGMTVTGNVAASNFVKQFRQQQIKALLIGHGLTWFSEWHDLTGDASDFVVTMDSPRVIAPYQQKWVEQYREKFGEDPSYAPSGHGYDYFRVAMKGLNQANTLDYDTLVETFRNVEHQGVWHHYDFAASQDDPNAMCTNEVKVGGFEEGFFFPMVQLKGGEATIIWPLKHAGKKFEQPPWI
jgi:branched-chain amino acid transport system substrate-binding protein